MRGRRRSRRWCARCGRKSACRRRISRWWSVGPYRYLYENGKIKRGHHGKVQFYFLCDFTGRDDGVDVARENPEFQAYRWIKPAQFDARWLPAMKRAVYAAVFADFFGVKI